MKRSLASLLAAGIFAMSLMTGCEPEEDTTERASAFDRLVSVSQPTAKSPPPPTPELPSATSRVHVTQPESLEQTEARVAATEANSTDIGVRLGTAARAGPITPEKFARWKAHEEKKIEVDIQRSRVRHQERSLALVEDREQQFLNDIDREVRVFGTSVENRLRTFERLKSKYSEELRLARREVDWMQKELAAWERRNLSPKPFDPFAGVIAMRKKLLGEIVSSDQAELLAAHEIKDSRTLALTFWSQPEHLARLLGVEPDEASRFVREAAVHLSKDEIEELEAVAERIRRIPPGVLPPEQKEEQP